MFVSVPSFSDLRPHSTNSWCLCSYRSPTAVKMFPFGDRLLVFISILCFFFFWGGGRSFVKWSPLSGLRLLPINAVCMTVRLIGLRASEFAFLFFSAGGRRGSIFLDLLWLFLEFLYTWRMFLLNSRVSFTVGVLYHDVYFDYNSGSHISLRFRQIGWIMQPNIFGARF